jgi:hypothetical protein
MQIAPATFSVRMDNLKILLILLFGAAMTYGAWYGLNDVFEFEMPGGKLMLIIYFLLFVVLVIAPILVLVAVILLIKKQGKLLEMTSQKLHVRVPMIGGLDVPWNEIKSVDLYSSLNSSSFVVFVEDPEKYLAGLSDLSLKTVRINSQLTGSPISLPIKFLNKTPAQILEAGKSFLAFYGKK